MVLRRVLVVWLLLLLWGTQIHAEAALSSESDVDVKIKSMQLRPCAQGQSFDCVKVEVVMSIDAPVETVWQVITDYQHAAEFISNLRSRKETPLAANSVMVEQIGRVGWGVVSVDIKTVYKVSLSPLEKRIQSVAVGGDLRAVTMLTQLKSNGKGGSLLEYSLITDPGPWAPLSIAEELLKRQARQSFEDLRREIMKRHGSAGNVKP